MKFISIVLAYISLKSFEMNLDVLNIFAFAGPHLFIYFFQQCTAFCVCVSWLTGVAVAIIFLSHWVRLSLTRTSSEFSGITVHTGWLINRISFSERSSRKRNLFVVMQCSHGKTEPSLCFLKQWKQWKIHPLRGDRSLKSQQLSY